MDIKSLRLERGWTQEELAERTGLSARTVQRIEKTGRGKWSSYRLMAKTLGVAERDLVADQVPRPLIEPRWAFGVGFFLALPALAFLATNVIRHQLGFAMFPDVFDTLLQFRWVDILSPFVFIGGCGIALVLNLGASIGFDVDIRQDALIPRRLVIYMSSSNLFLIILTATMVVAMLGYALLENLAHWIEPR